MVQGQISVSISPFLVIYANTSKGTQNTLTYPNVSQSVQIEVKLKTNWIIQDLAYLDHFATIWFVLAKQIHFPIPMSKQFVLANQNIFRD
jgi:hypothetical protein